MEPNENQLSSYYHHHHHNPNPHHHHHHHQSPTTTAAAASPTNGLLPNTHSGDGTHMVYPSHHSVPSAVTSPLEPAKRKRGRPRKYGTPEQALAAKKAATTSSHSSKEKKDHASASAYAAAAAGASSSPPSYSTSSSKKSQLVALGNAGQGFTPHVISVAAGEVCLYPVILDALLFILDS
ncbi:hypothetical protein PanWU01x14_253910 [Parasponia andersonii]|uniref:AT-hook motif nuclear-localized protein n=1 Tax=Parasponia andersonii TaxID=3476 RepID=A0A2P5BBB3_PARAD|nr:hypothetical protein PanWU01x14_253910 [Parasponia andersonii]